MVVLLPMILLPLQTVSAQSTNGTQYYYQEFVWDYGGHHWVWNLSIPVDLYSAYVSVPDFTRTQIPLSNFGYFTTTEDSYLQTLAQKLNETAQQEGYSSITELNFVLAFVQSIPYATDNASTGYQDYPRFPVETLVDNVGDCKSHSVLFATLSLMLDYGAVYINPPDHLAVGILGDDLSGTYWNYSGGSYYYCETTGSGFTIGQLPTQFNGQSAYVYGIDTSLQYIVNSQSVALVQPNPTIAPNTPDNAVPTPANHQPTPTGSPAVAGPTVEPDTPISFGLIFNDPLLFIIIIVAIGASIAVTLLTAKSTRQPRTNKTASAETVVAQETAGSNLDAGKVDSTQSAANISVAGTKFCIYCGATNKSFAVYCEKCGKKIS